MIRLGTVAEPGILGVRDHPELAAEDGTANLFCTSILGKMICSGSSRGGKTTCPRTAANISLAACLLLPWLNPFAPGPSSWVGPWLSSALCAGVAFAVRPVGAPHWGTAAFLGGLAGWAIVRSGWSPQALALAAASLLVWMMAALAAGAARRDRLVRLIALTWAAAAVISTAAALLQYFDLAAWLAPWVNQSTAGEAYANLRQRNQFASLTVIGMAAILWLAGRGAARWPAMAAMAWLAAGNAATTSRTGLLELLLLGAAVWWWAGLRSPRMRLWLLALAAYVAAAVALPLLAQVLTGEPANSLWGRLGSGESCGSRIVLWSNVLTLIAERPWLGWGWGELDFAHYTTLYAGPRFCDILDNAHNLPLHLAVELGLPAAAALCVVVAAAVWRGRPWRERDDIRQLAWTVLLVLGVHSLLEYPLWYGPFQMALGLALGLLWPARPAAAPAPAPMAGRIGTSVLALGALAVAAYAAWDYFRASQIYLPPERRAAGWQHDPLARLGGSWLFGSQVRFAQLTLTPVTRENAALMYEDAADLLHYSPEPAVIEKLLDSAVALGREDEALLHLARFRAAFPQAYAAWVERYRGSSVR